MRNMRKQLFDSPGNEEAKLAKIPGDGDPRVLIGNSSQHINKLECCLIEYAYAFIICI